MTKIWFFIYTILLVTCGAANAQQEYNSDTAENIQSIYWLTKAENSAIVYARFEGFYALRDLIDQTILAGNISSGANMSLDSADKLLLMMPEQENIVEILLTDNHLTFNGLNYQVDNELITKIKAMNAYRIEKGDLISPQTLSIAKENFGSLSN